MPRKSRRRRAPRSEVARLSRGREIVFSKNGLVLSTDTENETAIRIIESALSYERTVYLRGREAAITGRKVRIEEVACYRRVSDPDGVLPAQLVCPAGWLDKLRRVLKEHGFRVRVIDRRPHPEPGIFEPQWDRLKGIQLRWKQEEVIRELLKHEYGRVDCPTGWGKSWVIAAIARLLPKARIHITTHSADVVEQLYYDLAAKLPSVGIRTGKKKKRLHSRVMVYSGKSLHHGRGEADILIVDEVHEFGTVDYMSRVQKYLGARIYGFSASHNARADNADFELEGLFGPIRATVSYQEAVDFDCIVPIKVQWYPVVMDLNPVDGIGDSVKRNRWGIWRNPVRNRIIAKAARRFGEEDQVLIVVDTVDHAVHLRKFLPEFTLCYSEAGLDIADRRKYIRWGLLEESEPWMTSQRRFWLKDQFSKGKLKKVIATGVWNRGVDFKKLQVVIRADGKASKIADTQIPGRVARLDGEKAYGLVIDFLDNFDATLRRRAQKRMQNYREMGWEQILPTSTAAKRRRARGVRA